MHLKITKIFPVNKKLGIQSNYSNSEMVRINNFIPTMPEKKATLKDSFFQNVFEARDCFASRMKKREEKEKVKKCWSFARKRFLFFKC